MRFKPLSSWLGTVQTEDTENRLSPPLPLGGTWALVTVRSQQQPEAEEGMLAAVGWGESQGGRTPYFLPCLGQGGQNWPFSESQANRAPPRTGTVIITTEGYVFDRQYTLGGKSRFHTPNAARMGLLADSFVNTSDAAQTTEVLLPFADGVPCRPGYGGLPLQTQQAQEHPDLLCRTQGGV